MMMVMMMMMIMMMNIGVPAPSVGGPFGSGNLLARKTYAMLNA